MAFPAPVVNSRLFRRGFRASDILLPRWLPQRGWIRATLRKAEAARAAILEAFGLPRSPPWVFVGAEQQAQPALRSSYF